MDKISILGELYFLSLIAMGYRQHFGKKTTLRACKILYSFLANPVTNKNPKTAP
jgi:hypothetical protein